MMTPYLFPNQIANIWEKCLTLPEFLACLWTFEWDKVHVVEVVVTLED